MLSQQGHKPSPFCPRCSNAIETCDHVYKCSHPQAITNRQSFLQMFLSTLLSAKKPIHILSSFEYKLSLTLELPFLPSFHVQHEILPSTKNYWWLRFDIKTSLDGIISLMATLLFIETLSLFNLTHMIWIIHLLIGTKSLLKAASPSYSAYGMIKICTYMGHPKSRHLRN